MNISVIIPAYNAENYIGRQLDALAKQQTTAQWEVIVADNGSTDSTWSIVHNLTADFPVSLRLVDASTHKGAAYARNRAVASSTGEILAFCDADDSVGPQWVQAIFKAATSGADVVGGPIKVKETSTVTRNSGIVVTSWGKSVSSCNLAVRKDIFYRVGGFNTSFSSYGLEDSELCIRLSQLQANFQYSPEMALSFTPTASLKSLVSKKFRSGRSEVLIWKQHPQIFGDVQGIDRILAEAFTGLYSKLLCRPRDLRGALSQPVVCAGRIVELLVCTVHGYPKPEYKGLATSP